MELEPSHFCLVYAPTHIQRAPAPDAGDRATHARNLQDHIFRVAISWPDLGLLLLEQATRIRAVMLLL